MILFKKLSEEENSFVLKEYKKRNVYDEEIFYDDYKNVISIKSYLKRYINGADVCLLTIYNKFVVLFNTFGKHAAKRILAKEVHLKLHGIVKSYVFCLEMLDELDEFTLIKINEDLIKKINEVKSGRN